MKYYHNSTFVKVELTLNNFSKQLKDRKIIEPLKTLSILLVFLLVSSIANSQNLDSSKAIKADSLALYQLIKQVVENHPSIKEAEEAINMADAKIGLAKASYLPNVDAVGTYTRIGPVPEIEFSGHNFQMAPANNFNGALEYSQTIYDFGKTGKDVNLAGENKNLSLLTIEQLKQRMSFSASITFYNLIFFQEAIEIKDEELNTLNRHLEYIQKKKETGSATDFEILTTQVRITGIESQKIDLEAMQKIQLSIINSLLGISENNELLVKKDLETKLPEIDTDSLVLFAFAHRDDMKAAREKLTIANLQYQLTRSQANPSINIFAAGGTKNGYFPNLDQLKLNYAAGINFKLPIFDANRKKNNLLIAKSNINNVNYDVDIVGRNIASEVVQAKVEANASKQKIKQFEMQYLQAKRAVTLAEINFKSGVITNLELLEATTAVSESRLLLLKSKIDFASSITKLKNAVGIRLY